MRELDQKVVDQKGEQAFGEADAAEGKQRLASDIVVLAREKEENKIVRELVSTVPMRFVRTKKSKQPDELIARSGMLVRDCRNRVSQKAVKDINIKFNLKEWHELKRRTANYLGMKWKQDDQGVMLDMARTSGTSQEWK